MREVGGSAKITKVSELLITGGFEPRATNYEFLDVS